MNIKQWFHRIKQGCQRIWQNIRSFFSKTETKNGGHVISFMNKEFKKILEKIFFKIKIVFLILKKRKIIFVIFLNLFLNGALILMIIKVINMSLAITQVTQDNLVSFLIVLFLFLFQSQFYKRVVPYLFQTGINIIRWVTRKEVLDYYVAQDIWIDTIPGFRNVWFLVCSYLNFYFGLDSLSRFYIFNKVSTEFFESPIDRVFDVPVNTTLFLLGKGIVSLVLGFLLVYKTYCNNNSGTNCFDKTKGMLYIIRYEFSFPGKTSRTVLHIPLKDITCLILRSDPIFGDVLYIQTREQGILAVTPPNNNGRIYTLMEHGAELSRFLNIPLQVLEEVYFEEEEE
uniref:Photosystem I assembly protein Ycf4 n=1 Tax=Lathyrus cirrhosus TaxID=748638 RepID=D5MAE1_9FABA|nr:photosystem I assembly protein Ycf4 [Lathyrus cirrhosus]